MNEVIKAIKTRRSIRSFKRDPIPEDVLETIIEAGTYAPSGMNKQSPIIVAVTNKKERDRLSKWNAEIGGYESDPFYGAPVILLVLADKTNKNHVYDGALVMENLMLAAHSLGIGSIWINRAKEAFEKEKGKQWLASLGIHGEYEGIGHCALGYINGELPEAKLRKNNWVYYVK